MGAFHQIIKLITWVRKKIKLIYIYIIENNNNNNNDN